MKFSFLNEAPRKKDEGLKPNRISHTSYPDNPAKDYNEWMEHITASSIKRDADTFKEKFDALWDEFTNEIQNHAK